MTSIESDIYTGEQTTIRELPNDLIDFISKKGGPSRKTSSRLFQGITEVALNGGWSDALNDNHIVTFLQRVSKADREGLLGISSEVFTRIIPIILLDSIQSNPADLHFSDDNLARQSQNDTLRYIEEQMLLDERYGVENIAYKEKHFKLFLAKMYINEPKIPSSKIIGWMYDDHQDLNALSYTERQYEFNRRLNSGRSAEKLKLYNEYLNNPVSAQKTYENL